MNIMYAFPLLDILECSSDELQKIIHDAELLTQNNTGLTLQLAINYGGRDEIVKNYPQHYKLCCRWNYNYRRDYRRLC